MGDNNTNFRQFDPKAIKLSCAKRNGEKDKSRIEIFYPKENHGGSIQLQTPPMRRTFGVNGPGLGKFPDQSSFSIQVNASTYGLSDEHVTAINDFLEKMNQLDDFSRAWLRDNSKELFGMPKSDDAIRELYTPIVTPSKHLDDEGQPKYPPAFKFNIMTKKHRQQKVIGCNVTDRKEETDASGRSRFVDVKYKELDDHQAKLDALGREDDVLIKLTIEFTGMYKAPQTGKYKWTSEVYSARVVMEKERLEGDNDYDGNGRMIDQDFELPPASFSGTASLSSFDAPPPTTSAKSVDESASGGGGSTGSKRKSRDDDGSASSSKSARKAQPTEVKF